MTNNRKNGKNNKSKKNQDLETEEATKGPEMSANIAKVTRIFFLLAKNTRDKYRKNRKNKKNSKNQDLETEEAEKGRGCF